MENDGHPITTATLKEYIIDIAKDSGRETKFHLEKGPSKKFMANFMKKNPEISRRVPQGVKKYRSKEDELTIIRNYLTKVLFRLISKLKKKKKKRNGKKRRETKVY